MRITKLTLIISLLLPTFLISQVVEETASMKEGAHNAFVIELEGAEKKVAEEVWKDMLGAYGKVKRDRKAKEWRAESIVLPMVKKGYNINVSAKVEDLRGNARLYTWMKMDGKFLNSEDNTDEARGIKTLLEDYALEVEKAMITKEIESEQKKLNDLEKNLSKLVKKNEGYHNDIEKAEKAILEAEKNIEENVIDQEDKKIEIEEQKAVIVKVQEKLMAVGKKQ